MTNRRRKQHSTPDHDRVVADWQTHADDHDEANYNFLRSLKSQDYGVDPDELAGELHKQAFEIIDCTRCANCCKTMIVKLDESDVNRIAQHLGLAPSEFVDRFLEPAEQQGDFIMRQRPCPLLGADNRCTVYDVRPTECREYPHTDKPGFAHRTMGHAANALNCPAVFWIVEEMRSRVGHNRRGVTGN